MFRNFPNAFIVAALMVAGPSITAAEPLPLTRFFVPFYMQPIDGANGSRWAVETWLYSRAEEFVVVAPTPGDCGPVMCMSSRAVYAGEQPSFFIPYQNVPTGLLVHVRGTHANEVVIESKIRDISRNQASAGVEVPVVREDRFSAGALTLLNVPLDPRFRALLRVYALPEAPSREVEIRYLRMPPLQNDSEHHDVVVLRAERRSLQAPPAPAYPYGAEYLTPYLEIPSLASVPGVAGESSIWIEIRPVSPGLRIWAFVSITNNETQEVTLVTPPVP
ncbi:MAG: hypothetical protein M3Q69_13785 [Acidobacteriota bacterium]|nr:hypothetical protein [Acidobacteriota bacterium]